MYSNEIVKYPIDIERGLIIKLMKSRDIKSIE